MFGGAVGIFLVSCRRILNGPFAVNGPEGRGGFGGRAL